MHTTDALNDETRGIAISHAGERHPLSRPLDALLSEMELPLRRRFFPLGYPVEIMTNHPSVLTAAEQSFGHARLARRSTALRVCIGIVPGNVSACPSEPVRREFNNLFSLVADAENQALLDLKTGVNFTWLTLAAIANTLYFRCNFLEKVVYLLLGSTVVTDMHAACVSKHAKGVLLCGNSGAGKSTLAYACARHGWTYTSDDTSYLINDSDPPRVIGHCHRARFRPSSSELFPELVSRPLTPRMEGKPSIEVLTSELPVQHTAAEATVDAVVYLNRYAEAVPRLKALPIGAATSRARQDLFSAGEIRAKHEATLAKLWDIPAYDLDYCGLEDGIRLLDRLVREI